MFLDRVIHLGENLGDQVKGRSPKKLKTFIEVSNGVQGKEKVLVGNIFRIRSLQHVLKPSYPFVGHFGR